MRRRHARSVLTAERRTGLRCDGWVAGARRVSQLGNAFDELGLVWVVGSAHSLNDEANRAAQRLGGQMAQQGFRRIVGDWEGVDELVGGAFIDELAKLGVADPRDWIVQVRRTGITFRRHSICPGATVVEASSDDTESDPPPNSS